MIQKLLGFFSILFLCLSVSATEVYHAPNVFLDETYADWVVLELQLTTSTDKDIQIYWQGFGGRIDYMAQFIQTIREVESRGQVVTFILTGESYSAHAVSACYADVIVNNDKYFLMFHPAADDEGHVLTDPDSVSQLRSYLAICNTKGILTVEDIIKASLYSEIYVYKQNGKYIRYYKLDRRLH